MVLILTGRFHVAVIDKVPPYGYSVMMVGLTATYAKLLLISANQHDPDPLRARKRRWAV